MIKTQVIGFLGKDAIINDVNGKKVINYSVAHTTEYKDKNSQVIKNTLWVECSQWTDKTTVAQYLKKGTQVFVEGIPSIDTYKNNDGMTIPKLRLRVDYIQFLGSKKDNTEAPAADNGSNIKNDDLPF